MAQEGKKGVKTHKIEKAYRIRVCCKVCNGNKREDGKPKVPWLRKLYVIWAALPPHPAEGQDPVKPVFVLSQTDSNGYLSPLKNDLSPDMNKKGIPMVPGIEYLFYFVRHPSAVLPKEYLEQLEQEPSHLKIKVKGDGEGQTKEELVEPKRLKPMLQSTGKKNEGILEIPEDPEYFLPRGSSLYEGWVLFRDMPGSGPNRVKWDIQCDVLYKHVRRLQFHLGELRYPVGNQWHPYSPEPFYHPDPKINLKMAKSKGTSENLYPNEGVFDVATWNCVLSFQRDAKEGKAKQIKNFDSSAALVDIGGGYDPIETHSKDFSFQARQSRGYVSANCADVVVPNLENFNETVVDFNTGDAIKLWLDKRYRKPGKVLATLNDRLDSWMHEDAIGIIAKLDEKLKELGLTDGFRTNNSFRDIRMSVSEAGRGQAIYSIHKTGLAFDLSMVNYLPDGGGKNSPNFRPDPGMPPNYKPNMKCNLTYAKDQTASDDRSWIVYAEAPDPRESIVPASSGNVPNPPAGNGEEFDVEYATPDRGGNISIEPWEYDNYSKEGGKKAKLTAPRGKTYLNMTKLMGSHNIMMQRIRAHSQGWKYVENQNIKIEDFHSFIKFIGVLGDFIKTPGLQKKTAVVNGNSFESGQLNVPLKYLKLWSEVTSKQGFQPNPGIWVDPNLPATDLILKILRGKQFTDKPPKPLTPNGQKVYVEVIGNWPGGEGKIELACEGGVTKAKIALGPKTEFPKDELFYMIPITEPDIGIVTGSTVEFSEIVGDPAHLEWWHFQLEKLYKGREWGGLLKEIGWEKEGLLGRDAKEWIYGQWGLGYTPGDRGLGSKCS